MNKELNVHISKLQVRSPFKEIFRVKQETLGAIRASISKRGFDPNRPIETIKEEDGMYTIIDGHTRKQAVDDIIRDGYPTEYNAGNLQSDNSLLMHLPIMVHEFESEYDAVMYILRNQFERRNLDDIDLINAAECALGIYEKRYGKGSRTEYLSKLLPGLGTSKAKYLCIVLDKGSEEQIKSIRDGEINIYSTYKLLKENRPKKENLVNIGENEAEKVCTNFFDPNVTEEENDPFEENLSDEERFFKKEGENSVDEEYVSPYEKSRYQKLIEKEWAEQSLEPRELKDKKLPKDFGINLPREELLDYSELQREAEKIRKEREEFLEELRNPFGTIPLSEYKEQVRIISKNETLMFDGNDIFVVLGNPEEATDDMKVKCCTIYQNYPMWVYQEALDFWVGIIKKIGNRIETENTEKTENDNPVDSDNSVET